MNPTKLIDRIFEPRRKQIEKYSEHAEEIQEKINFQFRLMRM